jgi:hypothetical protein
VLQQFRRHRVMNNLSLTMKGLRLLNACHT